MSYGEDVLRVARCEKLRRAAAFVAIGFAILELATDAGWFRWARALAWLVGAGAAAGGARAQKRLGRDNDLAWLACGVHAVLGLYYLFTALRD